MATKYYDDGSYTKGDGKLYYPGLGVVGTDKNSSSSSNKTSSTNKTTSTSSKTSGSSSGGVSSMYKNNSSSSSSSMSILDKMMDNVKNNPLSSGGSSSNVNKTNSGWYVPSSSTNKPVVEEVEEVEEINPYEEKYNQLQEAYRKQEELLREQNRLAVEQGVNRLEAQKSGIKQSAEDNARQAYIMHMQSKKALPQQLASQGITGGATETANLGLQTTYQNNVNEINRNKANALQDIDNAIVDLQNTGDLSTVEQVLANNQAALNAYMNNLDKQVGYNQWAKQFNANREDTLVEQAYRDKVYADQMAQQELENQRYEQNYADNKVQQELENKWQQELYDNEKKRDEINRILGQVEMGLVDLSHASALLGVTEEQLKEYVNDVKRARALELSNTQSLINNRNNSSAESDKTTSASLLNNIINTATKMLNEREDVFGDGKVYRNAYGENDVKAYVLSQNITDEEQYKILTNLGLI